MKYTFTTLVPNIESDVLIENDGALEIVATQQIQTSVNLNTELPNEKVEELREAIESFYIGKFVEASTTLISKE